MNRKKKDSSKSPIWHPFTQMAESDAADPLIIESAVGNYLIDDKGKRYLDGVSSLWTNVHGHRKRAIDTAISRQLAKVAHTTLLGLSNEPALTLAKKLVEITPPALKRVFYSDNGSTAVEVALKMALKYNYLDRKPEKKKIISFTGAYHGDTAGSMSVGEKGIFTKGFTALTVSELKAPYPYCYRCPLGKNYPDCKGKNGRLACVNEFERIVKKEHKRIAACVIEPLVQGAAGIITSPAGFLKEIRRVTKKYDILLIADEVATGFGRTGKLLACEHERVTPDMLCLAKGITGGYLPLAATLTTDKIYKAFLGRYDEYKAFFHGHTYTGNPLGAAAAIANIDIFSREKVIERLKPKARLFKRLLNELAKLEHVGDVRVRGLMAGIELVKDKATKKTFPAGERIGHNICMRARDEGLILRPLGDVLVLMPPLSVTEREIKKMVKIVTNLIKELR